MDEGSVAMHIMTPPRSDGRGESDIIRKNSLFRAL